MVKQGSYSKHTFRVKMVKIVKKVKTFAKIKKKQYLCRLFT